MSRPHDIGGKDGFGPVDPNTPQFAENWEARQWALSKNTPLPSGTIDFWRHGIETMAPDVYETLPYFEKWCLNELAHRVDQGLFSMGEALSGRADNPQPPAATLDPNAVLERLRANNNDFRTDISVRPAFQLGDTVRTQETTPQGHTRLPAYALGKTGTIIAHHGGHLYADAGARGDHVGHHLYTVEFTALALWGHDSPDTTCLDLWEPYLAGA